jgi:hypothetical protein
MTAATRTSPSTGTSQLTSVSSSTTSVLGAASGSTPTAPAAASDGASHGQAAPGHHERRKRVLALGGDDEVDGQADRRSQAPQHADRVEVGVARDVQDQRETEGGGERLRRA